MNQRGFNLIGLIIFIGILAIMMMAIATFSTEVGKFFGRVNQTRTTYEVMEQLRFTLAKNIQCKDNFATKKMADPISVVSTFDTNNIPVSPIVTKGSQVHGLQVSDIRFRQTAALSTAFVQADLVVSFLDKSTPVNAPVERALPLLVQLQSGIIQNCWVQKDKTDIEVSQLCQVISNGVLTAYDPSSQKCYLPNGKWFTGTSTEASCPAGTILPPGANSNENCGSDAADVQDNFPEVSVTMTDGQTMTGRRDAALYNLDVGAKKCTCDWATDLDPAQVATAKCKILCLVP